MTKKTFTNDGSEFSAYYAAEKWLKENGYCVGSMQAHSPTGVVKGEGLYISKWRNLGDDRDQLDGQIEAGDFRRGDVTVTLKEINHERLRRSNGASGISA